MRQCLGWGEIWQLRGGPGEEKKGEERRKLNEATGDVGRGEEKEGSGRKRKY